MPLSSDFNAPAYLDDPDRVETPQWRGGSVLVVDDEPGMRNFLRRALHRHCALVEATDSAETAEQLRLRCHFDVMILDIRLPGRSGLAWLEELRTEGHRVDVIFITAYADMDTAVAALRLGAADFIIKPFRMEQIVAAVKRCLAQHQLQRENYVLRRPIEQLYTMDGMVGQTPAMHEVCRVIRRVAPTPSTILIEGESGTGKELAARAIHRMSGRAGPFVPVNCSAVAPELLESEFFGHTRGAFTGAQQAREGLFTYANGGTLFLDEISEMPPSMQAKLLRVLEERAIRPVGAERQVPVDVRIVVATNRSLAEMVRAGTFREDLYYRLNVLTIRMPPLRERMEDLPALVRFFTDALAAELGVPPLRFTDEQIESLRAYHWPGNVRELRNVIERALLLGALPADHLGQGADAGKDWHVRTGDDWGYPLGWTLEDVKKHHILRVLNTVDGNKSEAARRLAVSRKTLERKLARWAGGMPDDEER
ncbi:MAG: sigma-54 dependent transcriptional regulator [Gammaproteobacteria bacterium]